MRIKTMKINQVAVEVGDKVVFFSYDTEIAGLTFNGDKFCYELSYVTESWDYSQTTIRYFYRFLREYNIQFELNGKEKFGSTATAAELKKHIMGVEER